MQMAVSSQDICTDCNTITDSGWPDTVITPEGAAEVALSSLKGIAPAKGCAYQLQVDLDGAGLQVKMNLTTNGKPPVANCATK